jgi:SAM-dependent methyltransferase
MSDRFPADYATTAPEAGKSYQFWRASGFLDRFLSGRRVLDVGYRGQVRGARARPVVPHAIGVDLDYPGYDGVRLPFDDGTVDAVFSSHCLEHVKAYRSVIQDWHRVLKRGGFVVCIVPSQLLYEKKRSPPSRWSNDHRRFYTPKSLLDEFEDSLEENSYRVRFLEENDRGYTYKIGPDRHAGGCYEIIMVVEKIRRPEWSIPKEPAADGNASKSGLSFEEAVTQIYRGALGREPDVAGFANWVSALRNGLPLEDFVKATVACPEFNDKLARAAPRAQPLWLNELKQTTRLLKQATKQALSGHASRRKKL